jgi:hypothetical protein
MTAKQRYGFLPAPPVALADLAAWDDGLHGGAIRRGSRWQTLSS